MKSFRPKEQPKGSSFTYFQKLLSTGMHIRHALRDILILDALVKLEEIAIVHHTDCGTLRFTDEQLRTALKKQTNETHWAKIEAMEFGPASG